MTSACVVVRFLALHHLTCAKFDCVVNSRLYSMCCSLG